MNSSLPLLVAVFLVFIKIPSTLSNNDRYSQCGNEFICGNIAADFPFWGSNRPRGCGFPELELMCENDTATIEIEGVQYRVLEISENTEILRIAREDFMNGFCAAEPVNSTLDPILFDYAPGYNNLTFVYGCPSPLPIPVPGTFSCPTSAVNSQIGYIQAGVDGPGNCLSSVFVPVSLSLTSIINMSDLEEDLKRGFEVKWKIDNSACNSCINSRGVCGYDLVSNQSTCYCTGRSNGSNICPPSPDSAPDYPGFSRIGWRRYITIGLSFAAVAVIIVSIVIYCIRRKGFSSVKAAIFWWKNLKYDEKIEIFIRDYRALTPKRYSYAEIKKMTNSFSNKLGQGGFGGVYKGKLSDGHLVAVKILNKSKGDGEEFINEVASIGRTSHVNIVTLLGFCYEGTKRALIYEFMPNGSLDKFIYAKGPQHVNHHLGRKTLYEVAIGIARGLEYLHRGCNTRIVHFDIKPHNILLNEDFCPKISDFGLAKLYKSKESKISMWGLRGTIGYIAPEVYCKNFGGVSYKSDVYSYGMMILEMVGGRNNADVVGASDTSETYFPDWIYKSLEAGEVSTGDEEEETTRKMMLVGLWCIQTNPSDRPTMTKVVEMLEGSLQSLQIPPKPFSSPRRLPQEYTASRATSESYVSSQRDGDVVVLLNEDEL